MDKHLRHILENLEVPFNEEHWEQLAQHLDALPVEPSDIFDTNIANGVADIGANSTPDWDVFAEKLDAAEDATIDPIDTLIAGNLANLDVTATPDWGDFSSMLDNAEATNLATDNNIIDQKTQEHLDKYETPYQPETWPKMEERILENFSLRRRLMRYKVVEIALVVLLLFTVFNTISIEKLHRFNWKEFFHRNQEIEQTETPQEQAIVSVDKKLQRIDNERIIAQKSVQEQGLFTIPESIEEGPFVSNYQQINQAISSEQYVPVSPIALLDVEAKIEEETNVGKERMNYETTEEVVVEADKKRPLFDWLTLNKLDKRAAELKAKDATASLDLMKNTKHYRALNMGAITGLDVNKILSPYDRAYNINPDTTYASGYTGGLTFSYQFNRLMIETGGLYISKRYDTNLPSEVYGSFATAYFQENFQGISLDIVQVPLTLQYAPIQSNKWRIYGLAGASANVVLNTNYKILEMKLSGGNGTPEESGKGETNLAQKEFTEGISEGGFLRDNIFVNATLGMGIERRVAEHWSIYFQPKYQYQFSQRGIGPNENKFRSWSFHVGTRVNIFEK